LYAEVAQSVEQLTCNQ